MSIFQQKEESEMSHERVMKQVVNYNDLDLNKQVRLRLLLLRFQVQTIFGKTKNGKEWSIRIQIRAKGMDASQISKDQIVYKNSPKLKLERKTSLEQSLNIIDLTSLFKNFVENATPLREISELACNIVNWTSIS